MGRGTQKEKERGGGGGEREGGEGGGKREGEGGREEREGGEGGRGREKREGRVERGREGRGEETGEKIVSVLINYQQVTVTTILKSHYCISVAADD